MRFPLISLSLKSFYGIMRWRFRLNTSKASNRYFLQEGSKSLDGIWANSNMQMSSINPQTPIIYPCVVFFSIRIVPISYFHLYQPKLTVLNTLCPIDPKTGLEVDIQGTALPFT